MNFIRGRARLLAIVGGFLALSGIIARWSGARSTVEGWSLGTAYAAFILLAISLSLGPVNVLRGAHNPVHVALRRDIGISAGIVALVHTALGLQVHMGGVISRYFSFAGATTPQLKVFVATNYLGLASAILLALLVAVSNAMSIRSLGLKRWKSLQRLAYPAVAAATVHGLAYQFLEGRSQVLIGFITAVAVAVTALQVRGARITRTKQLPIISEEQRTAASDATRL